MNNDMKKTRTQRHAGNESNKQEDARKQHAQNTKDAAKYTQEPQRKHKLKAQKERRTHAQK